MQMVSLLVIKLFPSRRYLWNITKGYLNFSRSRIVGQSNLHQRLAPMKMPNLARALLVIWMVF
ncbi:MAG: hypothetical protein AUJ20_11060 [Comamonadaceae bacterium CG1_02_60_18]|nr:MAG: hypothetical protein AUJ20_11060 [Comamonadaceae bacterium CG1_02_60_18]PIQ52867.1 MAG: hypothetical protein COW02_08830 [Comamonadaceae bacterium CG12_big_fil_rev_8_21_14_0_65_59_15]